MAGELKAGLVVVVTNLFLKLHCSSCYDAALVAIFYTACVRAYRFMLVAQLSSTN